MIIKDIELKKWGNSQGIRIGKEELAEIGEFDTNVTFKMVAGDGKITLIPKKEYPTTLDELFEDYDSTPLGREDKYDWDDSQGREIL
ncbi:AbrB/MazE/SpoVT family DNA-binding domain-containing protein [Enterococcus sp. AZ072]|uniref:AbrB/MazE/SpoVT family DNA-binding domain-containing protein n=1 Tax=unclassified Enterococcus TaxID=2608891 RepID=UPI003D287BE6